MKHSEENIKLAQALGKSLQFRDIRVAWLGKIDSAGVVNPDPKDGLEMPYVWVRFEENGEAVRAINLKVSSRMPNVRVHVARSALNGQLTVLGLAEETAVELGDIAPTLNIPDRIADLILELLDTNRIKPLRVSPGEDAFDVDVAPGFYWYQGELRAWMGGTINIATSVPGGFNTKRPVLIGIDPDTETLVSYDGTVAFMTVPPLDGKMFTEAVIAQTVEDAAMPAVVWIACIPLTVNDGDWVDYFRTTALQFVAGNGTSITAGIALNDLTDVIITTPAADDELYFNGTNWVNGKITVLKTGDTMTGTLTVNTTNTSTLNLTSVNTLASTGSVAYSSVNDISTINSNGFDNPNTIGLAAYRTILGVSGSSGTVTGVAGSYVGGLKSNGGTLTNFYGHYVDTVLKLGGTLNNIYGVYLKTQTAGSSNFGFYQDGLGLNRLGDQLSIVGGADRIQQIIRLFTGQTANGWELQNNSSTILANFNSAGDLTLTNNVTKSNIDTARLTVRNDISYSASGAKAPSAFILSTNVTPTVSGVNGTVTGLNGSTSVSGSQSFLGIIYGVQYQSYWQGNGTATSVIGVLAKAGINNSAASSAATNLYGIQAGINPFQGNASFTSTVTNSYSGWFGVVGSFARTAITNLYGVYIANHTPGAGSSITNQKGLYIESMTSGATLNYAIQTNLGDVLFGDDVVLNANDSDKVWWGAGKDAWIAYDGTNMLITPDAVGTGFAQISTAQALALVIGKGSVGVDYQLKFDGETNDGVLTWMEDEDYLKFEDDTFWVDGENLVFGTTTGTKFATSTTQKMGWWNATPVVQSTGWSVTNPVSRKSFDTTTVTHPELAETVGTIIDTLKTYGLYGA